MTDILHAKRIARAYHDALDAAPDAAVADTLATHMAPDVLWRGMHPFHEQTGPEAIAETFWLPLRRALGRLSRRPDIFIGGANHLEAGGTWVASAGHFTGTFDAPFLTIPPSRKMAFFRYAEFLRVDGDRITESAMFCDILGLALQAGIEPLMPQTGAHVLTPGPITHDGLRYAALDPEEAATTLALIESMATNITEHRKFDSIEDELAETWAPDMLWYGPTGIGSAYTIPRYIEQHAGPFREGVSHRTFNGHVARFGDGIYGGFFGWPNLTLETQESYLGQPARSGTADMRVVDLYRREGDRLKENWVYIDIPHFLMMQGFDVLARIGEMAR